MRLAVPKKTYLSAKRRFFLRDYMAGASTKSVSASCFDGSSSSVNSNHRVGGSGRALRHDRAGARAG